MNPDQADDWVRHVLHDAVHDVEPTPALDEIRARTGHQPAGGRRWVWGAGGAALAVAATVAAFAALNSGDRPQRDPDVVAPSPTVTVDPTPTESAVPVYYLGEVDLHENESLTTGFRLFREFHRVPAPGSPEDVALAAVREMLSGQPHDPDYGTGWAPGVGVTAVDHADGVISVDLTGPVQQSTVGAEAAELAVQQLVYTVQGALASAEDDSARDPVQILVEGSPVSALWGHVDTSEPVERAAPTGVQSAIWIIEPAEGDTVSAPVQVSGLAQVFEANVSWRVLAGDTVVDEGFSTASKGAPGFGEFSFELDLPPGTYTVEAFESSALDGSPIYLDDKEITIE